VLAALLRTGGAVAEIDTIQVRSSANLHHVDLGETAPGGRRSVTLVGVERIVLGYRGGAAGLEIPLTAGRNRGKSVIICVWWQQLRRAPR